MGLEDALLLSTPDRKLMEEMMYADERVSKHEHNESNRIQAGLQSDLERWLNTGIAFD